MAEVDLQSWFARRISGDWAPEGFDVLADRDEILVLVVAPTEGDTEPDRATAQACIERFREASRDQRMRIAAEAERRYRRKVSWGATCGEYRALFTNLTVPVMTRLRLPERRVLDTLIDAGVARSRSDALAWCVRLVATHEDDWLAELREAFARVEHVRASGPQLD